MCRACHDPSFDAASNFGRAVLKGGTQLILPASKSSSGAIVLVKSGPEIIHELLFADQTKWPAMRHREMSVDDDSRLLIHRACVTSWRIIYDYRIHERQQYELTYHTSREASNFVILKSSKLAELDLGVTIYTPLPPNFGLEMMTWHRALGYNDNHITCTFADGLRRHTSTCMVSQIFYKGPRCSFKGRSGIGIHQRDSS